MGSTRNSRLLFALARGFLPWIVQVLAFIGLVVWLGGLDGLSETMAMAGRPVHRLNVLILVSTLALSAVLFLLASRGRIPAAAPLVLSTVPWLVGIWGSMRGTQEVIDVVQNVNPDNKAMILTQGSGEILSASLLGVWFSASLMLATAGALLLSALERRSEPAPGAGSRLLEAGLALGLAIVCLLTAFETKALSLGLTSLASVEPAYKASVLAQAVQQVQLLSLLRMGVLAATGLLVIALGLGALRRPPRDTLALLALVPLVLVEAGALWAQGQPLLRMRQAVSQAVEPPVALAGVRLLPFGDDAPLSEVQAVAGERGLSRPGSGPELPWSSGDEALGDWLVAAAPRPDPEARGSQPALQLAVDARVPISALRRLLDVASQRELPMLRLVGLREPPPRDTSQEMSVLPPVLRQFILAQRATVSCARVLLPPMLQSPAFIPGSIWAGELGATHQVKLSESMGEQEARTLELTAPDPAPDERIPKDTVLVLIVTEAASLEDVAHAVRKARLLGFEVLLSSRPPSRTP